MSPAIRNLSKTSTSPNLGKKYRTPFPGVKADVADRIRAVEAASGVRAPRASRCCGRCKTPYNCGNAGCACHSQARLQAGQPNPL